MTNVGVILTSIFTSLHTSFADNTYVLVSDGDLIRKFHTPTSPKPTGNLIHQLENQNKHNCIESHNFFPLTEKKTLSTN